MQLGYTSFSQKLVGVLGQEETLPWARWCNKLLSTICIVVLSEFVSQNVWLQQYQLGFVEPTGGKFPFLGDWEGFSEKLIFTFYFESHSRPLFLSLALSPLHTHTHTHSHNLNIT